MKNDLFLISILLRRSSGIFFTHGTFYYGIKALLAFHVSNQNDTQKIFKRQRFTRVAINSLMKMYNCRYFLLQKCLPDTKKNVNVISNFKWNYSHLEDDMEKGVGVTAGEAKETEAAENDSHEKRQGEAEAPFPG